MNLPRPAAADRFEAYFRDVLEHQMRDMPLAHPDLEVETRAWRHWQSQWLGVLVTPWCMNLVLLGDQESSADCGTVTDTKTNTNTAGRTGSDADADASRSRTGERVIVAFPSGNYDFTGNHDDSLGYWRSCSLYSPMFEFDSQVLAREVADQAIEALFDTSTAQSKDCQDERIDLVFTGTDSSESTDTSRAQADEDDAPVADQAPVAMTRRRWMLSALQRGSSS